MEGAGLGAFGSSGESADLRASFPAMLCHGVSGPSPRPLDFDETGTGRNAHGPIAAP